MRKVDPAGVRADFDAFANERLAHFSRLEGALAKTSHEKRDLSILAETALHSTYVAFEVFVSDLLLAYINRNVSTYRASVQADIQKVVKPKLGAGVAGRATFQLPKHINLHDLESTIDPTGWNLTFKSVAVMQTKFADWVDPALGGGVAALNGPDTRLIDAARSIRNFTAHNSAGSKTIMNDMLFNVSTGAACPNASLSRGVHEINDVGAYLKSVSNGKRRLVTYVERLQAIAATL